MVVMAPSECGVQAGGSINLRLSSSCQTGFEATSKQATLIACGTNSQEISFKPCPYHILNRFEVVQR